MRGSIKSNPMPSRWIIAGTLIFWAATLSWLVYREIMPDLRSDEPQLFYVQAADEQRTPQGVPKIFWNVERNGKLCYSLRTSVQYDENEDLFEFLGNFVSLKSDHDDETAHHLAPNLTLQRLRFTSHYWADRHGRLTTLDVDTNYDFVNNQTGERMGVTLGLQGNPRGGKFAPMLKLAVRDPEESVETELDAVAVSSRGCVLHPLHPPRRIPDLRPGQTWNAAVIDPLFLMPVLGQAFDQDSSPQVMSAFSSMLEVKPLQVIHAKTDWNETELQWPRLDPRSATADKPTTPCYVVTWGEPDSLFWFKTWAHATDGWVLKQEAHLWGETWIITRISLLH